MSSMKQLPKSVWKYFWDTEVGQVDVDKNSHYIIERVLEWGRTEDIKWLIGQYGMSEIKKVLMSSRQMPQKQANFWASIWDIPREEVLCLQPEFRQIHRQHWQY